MGSRYEGEKAISLDTSPPRTPLLPTQTFFQGQWRSSWHASPSPADRLPRLFPSACTPPIFPRKPHPGAWRAVCAWLTDARRLRLPLGPFSCRFPSCRGQRPVSCHRPSPVPPLPAIGYCRDQRPGLPFRGAHQQRLSPSLRNKKRSRPAGQLRSIPEKQKPETTGVRPPDGPSRRSPPGCSRLP